MTTLTTRPATSSWLFEIGHHEGGFHTRPPFLSVAPTSADLLLEDGSYERWAFHITDRHVQLLGPGGEVIALARALVGRRRFSIEYRDRAWPLEVAANDDRCIGWIDKHGAGGGRVDVTYVHDIDPWHTLESRRHREREHRAWFIGQVRTYTRIPAPVIALAMRCTLNDEWFERRTGSWIEHRRAFF